MNFQDLTKIESANTFLDVAFRNARTRQRPKFKNREKAIREAELDKIRSVKESLSKNLNNIIKKFPSLNSLPEFYLELVKVTMEYPKLKKSLGAVDWALKRINILFNKYNQRMRRVSQIDKIKFLRTEFYGRVSSVMKQIGNDLINLDQARIIMRRFPNIKTSLFTVAISGYPNVGKSSLLALLTTAKPEIREYAFTTKSLNLGYTSIKGRKVQIVDTPGTFARSIDKLNVIEKQALLALKHVSHLVIFLIDPTKHSGYRLKPQKTLLKRIKKLGKDTIICYSKSDLVETKEQGILYFSAVNKDGLVTLRQKIEKHLEQHEPNSQDKDNKS